MYIIEQYVNTLIFTGIFALCMIAFEVAFAYVYVWYEDRKQSRRDRAT